MLRFEHVSLSYGSQKIIDDISFEIQEGQMAVLIGSSDLVFGPVNATF